MEASEASLPKGGMHAPQASVHCCILARRIVACRPLTLRCTAATLQKIVREALPPDVRIAGDAVELILECCTGAPVPPVSSTAMHHHRTAAALWSRVARPDERTAQPAARRAQSSCSWCLRRPTT